jgi:hypothetical protein
MFNIDWDLINKLLAIIEGLAGHPQAATLKAAALMQLGELEDKATKAKAEADAKAKAEAEAQAAKEAAQAAKEAAKEKKDAA